MKGNFDKCFQWLMIDEGGYTNDPADSGGATKYGITIGDYRRYIKSNATPEDVRTLTQAQARAIYKSKYWDTIGGDSLPSGVDNACFNYGVLAGIGRPKANIKRFADIKDPHKLIDAMCDEMKQFLNNLATRRPKDERFRKGWNARVDRLRKNSHSLANDKVSGPVAGAAAGGSLIYTMWDYVQHHPYVSAAIVLATVTAVWMLVHAIRNKK